jgi:hypothetical protein
MPNIYLNALIIGFHPEKTLKVGRVIVSFNVPFIALEMMLFCYQPDKLN